MKVPQSNMIGAFSVVLYNKPMNPDNKASEEQPNPEKSPDDVLVRKISLEDLDSIKLILEFWIKNPGTQETIHSEVDGVIESIKDSLSGNGDKKFYVAVDTKGNVLGMMGYSEPSKDMAEYSQTDKPVEFINAYVDAESRGQGVGKLLAKHLENEAKLLGYKEIIVNSGPRYQETGWAFWTRIYESPIAVLKDYYGSGRDAPVWQKFIGLNKTSSDR
jgi:L-amino acid N-acyltransferase YncA